MTVDDSATKLLGVVLDDRFRIERPLGAGGMAQVYMATDLKLAERQVAIKVPHAALLAEPGFKERFMREMDSLIRLDHPRIVKVLDAGEHDGLPYVVMQFLAGGSLRDRLGAVGTRCSAEAILSWLPAVCEGLDFLHSQDLIHRDVKPENLLFDQSGNVFIADFGIAKALGSLDTGLTLTGTTPGTPFYMGPEISTGQPITGAYDQYALATMTYEALAGKRPFDADTPMRLLFMKASDQAPPILDAASDLAPGLAEAIMRGLRRDPAHRFPNCGSFAQAIASNTPTVPVQTGGPDDDDSQGFSDAPTMWSPTPTPTSVPLPPTEVATARSDSKKWSVLLAVLLVLGGVGFCVYYFDLWPKPPVVVGSSWLASCEPPTGATVPEGDIRIVGTSNVELSKASVDGKAASVAGKAFEITLPARTEALDSYIVLESTDGATRKYEYRLTIAEAEAVKSLSAGDSKTGEKTELPAAASTLKLEDADPPRNGIVGREFTFRFSASQTIQRATVAGEDAKIENDRSVSIPIVLDPAVAGDPSPVQRFIAIELVDKNGEVRNFQHAVRADLVGPEIQTMDPDNGASVGSSVDLMATVSEEVRSVSVGGRPAKIGPDGRSFQIALTVPLGGLNLDVVLADVYDNERTTKLRLVAKTDASFSLESFTSGTIGRKTVIKGKSSNRLASVTVDAKPATISADGMSFEIPVEMTEAGSHEFTVLMEDASGSRATEKRSVVVDLTGPKLVTSVPAMGAVVDSRFLLTGTSDEELQSVKVDNKPGTAEGKRFRCDFVMPGLTHTVKIELVDRFGNPSVHQIALKGDNTALSLETNPASGKSVTTARVDLQITANRQLASATIKGKKVTAVEGRSATQRLTLSPGENTFPIRAVDGFGKAVTVSYVLTFRDPSQVILFKSDLSLNVKYLLANGNFTTRGRVAVDRPAIKVLPTETWLVEPEKFKFDSRAEFTKLVTVLRDNKVPGLELSENRSKSCDLLVNLPNLERLILNNTPLGKKGLDAVVALKGLKSFTMKRGDIQGRDLNRLAAMQSLEHLQLEYTPKVKTRDLEFLKGMPNLKSITLKGRFRQKDIDAFNLNKGIKVVVGR